MSHSDEGTKQEKTSVNSKSKLSHELGATLLHDEHYKHHKWVSTPPKRIKKQTSPKPVKNPGQCNDITTSKHY